MKRKKHISPPILSRSCLEIHHSAEHASFWLPMVVLSLTHSLRVHNTIRSLFPLGTMVSHLYSITI